ncbi:insulinase family protein [Mucilaginibacter sp. ZT4R22]|uniref:Insulinase family protein n=1 Tax=Mucilaginibacter pankratovii TaxID=2772110 RepID=A0ABR7WJZ9_9SPHI|nr:insulinase family protein [Mucilaginibacter pankratovii]MBD1362649.1 insulinase family protein [Mucilaginibacter pankratovii]
MQISKLTFFAGLLFFSAAAIAQEKPLPLDPAVRTGKLANGFSYYIRHNAEPKKRVVFYLANKVGSVLESEDQRGLAHFMEHMSFNGTKHFPKNELVNYLQKSGVRFGADLNAYTSFDETVYQLPLPTDNPELLQKGIAIMRDWAQEATLDPVEINKERGVVLEEKRLGKGAQERMRTKYWPLILNNSRYAERIPIGTDEVLNNFKPETIRRFYHDWYRPDLQALIVVGDVDIDQMEQTIKTQFGNLKNPANEKARAKYTVALAGTNQFISLTDKEVTSTTIEVLFKRPMMPLRTASEYRNSIIRELYNQMLSERYAELSRQANPPFVSGGAGIGSFIGGLDNFDVSLVARPGQLEKGFKAVWRETERVKRFGFTSTELDRAKQSYLNNMDAALKEKNKTNSDNYVQEYLAYFLKGTAAPGIQQEYEMVRKDLPGIALNEVNRLSGEYFTQVNRDILLMAPEKDKNSLPDEATVNSWIKTVADEKLGPYKDEVSTEPLIAVQPLSGKVTSTIKDDKLGTTLLTLSNGVKVLLKPTGYKDNEVLFTAFAPGGTSLYPDSDYQSAANAAGIIPSFGAGNFNPTQLDKFLSGKQLVVRPYISERMQGVSGAATLKDLETALELLYTYYTSPRKDTELFQGILARSKASLQNRANEPGSVFKDTISAVLGKYNIRRTGPTLAKLDQISLDRSFAIYKERFGDASGLVFTFVGSFDVEQLQPLLEKYIGSLPASGHHTPAKDLNINIPVGKIEKIVYKGTEPKASVQLYWSGNFTYNTAEKVTIDALRECLEIRLLERLREGESGVYSPGVLVQTSKYPKKRYTFEVQFGCGPHNVNKLIASTLDEISKLKTQGPSQMNVDKWRAESIRARESESQTNRWWLSYLNGQESNSDDLHALDTYQSDLQKVTPERIKAAANMYLGGENYIQLVLLPENQAKS